MVTVVRVTYLVVLLVLVADSAFAQVPADLQKTMDERDKAVANVDAATWDRLTSADFTLVDETGVLMNKSQRLAQLKTQKAAPAPPRSNLQIKHYGDVYVRRFLIGDIWVLDIWVRESTGWRVAAVQVTTAKK